MLLCKGPYLVGQPGLLGQRRGLPRRGRLPGTHSTRGANGTSPAPPLFWVSRHLGCSPAHSRPGRHFPSRLPAGSADWSVVAAGPLRRGPECSWKNETDAVLRSETQKEPEKALASPSTPTRVNTDGGVTPANPIRMNTGRGGGGNRQRCPH